MKKYLFVVASALLTILATGQIKIIKLPDEKIVGKINGVAEITYTVNEDTIYTFRFKDQQYKVLSEYDLVTFKGRDNTLDKLYKIFKSVFLTENKNNNDYKVALMLGDTAVVIGTLIKDYETKSMFFTSSGHTYLSEEQVDKLFGK